MPANEAWDLFGTLRIGQLVEQQLSHFIQKVALVEGDGGVGTVLKLIFGPGIIICLFQDYMKHMQTTRLYLFIYYCFFELEFE